MTGPLLCAQSAARHMLLAGRGVIINISFVMGHLGMPQRAAYAGSKHGLIGLTKVLASEWGPAASSSFRSIPVMSRRTSSLVSRN